MSLCVTSQAESPYTTSPITKCSDEAKERSRTHGAHGGGDFTLSAYCCISLHPLWPVNQPNAHVYEVALTTPGARRSGVLISAGVRYFSLLQNVKARSGDHPGSSTGTEINIPGVNRPECKVDHSPRSSAEIKNGWTYTSTPPIRLHGVVTD
jgi:hypothetical protein